MNAEQQQLPSSKVSRAEWLRAVNRTATGIMTLLMFFYFLLVAAALTPSPFEPGQGLHFPRYALLSLLLAYAVAFLNAPGSAEARIPARRSGLVVTAAKEAVWLFPVSWVVLAVIQVSNQWLGLTAPLAATSPVVITALLVLALGFGFLMALVDRRESAPGED